MKENFKKILIATPMMPPTPGGPGTHAAKLFSFFAGGRDAGGVELLNFEKYKFLPSGLRHVLIFLIFIFHPKYSFLKYDVILVLDGFTVAIPAIIAGKILRKKVVLRIGGDFVHEQFISTNPIPLDKFYLQLKNKEIGLRSTLKIKFLFQKFVLENCSGIIFNSIWQKQIYENFYRLPEKIWIVLNPVEIISHKEKSVGENFIFISAGRDTPIKNINRVRLAFEKAKNEINLSLILDTEVSSFPKLVERFVNARACICASISEVSPNTVSTALSLGLPVIMTKHSGYTDFLKDKGIVRFVDPSDVEDIKKAILEMCDDVKYLEYKKNLENFTWPQTWESLFVQYERIIEEMCTKK